ncbi:hypothetical protein T10_4548 [Trichinella papuae]|nr:hypothetical protein T10_5223 [Trichinella papuae]KRZ65998.1 hypothetical protein T10_4548 [Trichinella papuae]
MDGKQQLSVLMRYDVALIIHARIVTSSVMLFPVIKRFWIWYAFWKSEIPVSSVVICYSFEWPNIGSSTAALASPSVCMVSHVAAIFVAFISISNVKWRCTGKSGMYLMYNQPSTVADLVIQNSQKHKSYFSTLMDMYAVDLEVQCKVVSAYETLNCTERRRCEREVGLRQHRFRDSRCLLQTGQPVLSFHVQTSAFKLAQCNIA